MLTVPQFIGIGRLDELESRAEIPMQSSKCEKRDLPPCHTEHDDPCGRRQVRHAPQTSEIPPPPPLPYANDDCPVCRLAREEECVQVGQES